MSRYYDTVTIVTPGTSTDRYNNAVANWSTATTVTSAAWVGPTSTTETVAAGDKVVAHLSCHLPPAVAVTATCRLVWRGDTYEVDGKPQLFMRKGAPHHFELALKRVEG